MDKKLKFKNFFGYGLCDLGNNIGFSCVSSYLTLYYTDVIGKGFEASEFATWSLIITIIMIIARVWDGINDPMMGMIVQNTKPRKGGKFRPWILMGGIPLAIAFIIMFLPINDMSLVGATIFAFITYIAYGMLYTVVLVPYGSMATVMTREENERSLLSIARSIGGGIGGIPTGILFPILVYTTLADGTSVLDPTKLFIAIIAIAVIMLISYCVSYFLMEEKYPYNEKEASQKLNVKETIKSLIKNKPFVIASLVGMLLIASSMFINSIDVYVFNVYYGKTGMMAYVTVATYLPMVALIPFTGKIIKNVGKKEIILPSLLIASIASLVMFLWKIPSPIIFIIFVFFQGVGVGFITLEIWAMAMDVIDYQEMLTGKREEAPTYAFFTFMRKIGQALAAFVPLIIASVGYVSASGYNGQSEATKLGIYNLATIIPFILFTIMFILMIFYPLSKKEFNKMKEKLKVIRGDKLLESQD